MMQTNSDLLDALPPNIAQAVDRLGYALLEKAGYDVSGAGTRRGQRALSRALSARGDRLVYHLSEKGCERGCVKLCFCLLHGDGEIARSPVMKLVYGAAPKGGREET